MRRVPSSTPVTDKENGKDYLRSIKYFLYASKCSKIFRDYFLGCQFIFKFATDKIRKGGVDDREFRYILLNNNLKCMLVSDKET
jgi:hypothetical protein